jgi:restriction endonuclease S subunit
MIQKSRGATPSRRRLSHEDFAELPFPDIDKSLQDKIANVFIENVNRAKALKKEAIEALEQAKKEVEKILFE